MTAFPDRAMRLEKLRTLLSAGTHAIVADLARELGVSPRTLMRDLDVLRDEGMVIETERGRGGGVRLGRGQATARIQLNAPEALDLLVSLAIAEKLHSPLIGPSLREARHKLAAAFDTRDRSRIAALRRRVLIGAPASARVAASYTTAPASAAARSAFLEQRLLEIAYRDEFGAESNRVVEPQFLYLTPPAWYFLAWDHLRDGVRAFRFDRILHAHACAKAFRLRSPALFVAAAEAGVETP